MRLIFAGTPVFAARALQALVDAGHQVVAVLCQPDRPAGRGQKLVAGPVKTLALQLGLPVLQPLSLRDAAIQAELAALQAEVWVVAAYGLLLPAEVLAQPPFGCLNIHASLLPRWRGAAPIQRAILAGDTETGVGIMQMETGLDTGAVLREQRVPISLQDTGSTLHDRLAALGATLIVDSLANLAHDRAHARPQSADGLLYAAKLRKEEGHIDWSQPTVHLQRLVRAFDPVPGARFSWQGQPVRVAHPVAHPPSSLTPAPAPGTVLAAGSTLAVATGDGVLHLHQLQRPGGRMQPVREFLQAVPLQPGDCLE